MPVRITNQLVKLLLSKNLTLALAESVTCGLAAHQLATVKGTSEVLKGSIVCYTEEVKTGLLGVKKSLIKKYTAESAQVTDALVNGLRKLIDADIYVAITGLSSEGGSETKGKPVGTTFISFWFKSKKYKVRKVFRGTPLQIRRKMCAELYREIIRSVVGGR
jgi:nicotinamide-nucleotide amidase